MNKVKKFFANPTHLAIVVTLAFLAIHIPLIFTHEPFCDEATPWQMAKEINFTNLYSVLSVEPHAPLWYLILAPFAQLGFPYLTINFISLAIMAIAVFLLIRYSPFKTPVKLLLVLSAVYFYFNPVISRDYCLTPLFLTFIALAYPQRLAHPIRYGFTLALACQCHFLTLPLVGILTIGFIIEYITALIRQRTRRRPRSSARSAATTVVLPSEQTPSLHYRLSRLLAGLVLVALSFASLLPPMLSSFSEHAIIDSTINGARTADDLDVVVNDNNRNRYGSTIIHENKEISRTVRGKILPTLYEHFSKTDELLYGIGLPILEITFVMIAFYLLCTNLKLFCYFTPSVLVFIVATHLVYNSYFYYILKLTILLSAVVFIYWISFYESHKSGFPLFRRSEIIKILNHYKILTPLVFVVPLVLTIPNTFYQAYHDFTGQALAGVEPALRDKISTLEDDAIFMIAIEELHADMVKYIPYFKADQKAYDVALGQEVNHFTYRKDYAIPDSLDIIKAAQSIKEQYHTDHVYYFSIKVNNCNMSYTPDGSWESIGVYNSSYTSEDYADYTVEIFKVI